MDISGFIFEKLSPEEPHSSTPLTMRQKDEEHKNTKENEYNNMQLTDKLLYLHKLVYDPHGEVLPQVKYEADPDTGKLVRKGNSQPPKGDPFEVAQGMTQFNDFYENPSK